MQHQRHPRRHLRLAAILVGLGLVTTACGSETVTSSEPVAKPTTPVAVEAPTTTTAPPSSAPDSTAPPTTAPATTAPPSTAPTTTAPSEPPVEPAAVPEATPTTTEPPVPEPIDDLTYDDEPGPCTLPAMPVDTVIGGEVWFDLGPGYEGQRVVSYLSGGAWKLRVEFTDGAASELEIPGAGVHGVRPIGFADVDLTFGGEELLAVVGGGASTVEIGMFAFLEGGCIHRYQSELGGDFSVHVGATTEWGTGLICGDGYVVDWGYERDPDDTYATWSAAFEPVSLPVFGYIPASDDVAEGLTLDEVSATPLFDCNGLEL